MRRIGPIVAMAVVLTACATSPLGRQQLVLMPEGQLDAMGAAAFQQVSQTTPRTENPAVSSYVNCVAQAITREAGGSGTWEVAVFEDEAVNAFALPGGRIGVYRGLLNVADTPDELAAVIGHEVAHVLARHANERVSQQFAAEQGLALLESLTSGVGSGTQKTLMALLGVGAQVGVLLPYSRLQESEADKIGVDLMARAGFDPRGSIQLWRDMQQAGGADPPEFLSTHPATETRIAELQGRMEHAMGLYQQARGAGKRPDCVPP